MVTLRDVYEQRFTRLEELAATQVDLLQWVVHYTASAVVKDPNHLKKPEPIPRPGVPKKRRRGTTLGELKAMTRGGVDA